MRAIIKTHDALNGRSGDSESYHVSADEWAYLVNADAANGVVLLDSSGNLVGPISVRNETEADTNDTTLLAGEIAWTSDTDQIRLGDGVTEGGVAGNMASSTTILCPSIGTPVENAARLRAVYTAAKSYTPGGSALSATNRVQILLGAGTFDFELGDVADLNHGLELDTEFIDLAGITGNPADVILTSAIVTESRGTVEQTADDVRLSGFTIQITVDGVGTADAESAAYFPATALSNTVLKDIPCDGTTASAVSMRSTIEYAGEYTNVSGGDYSFGRSGVASGTFTNCVAGDFSFSINGTASGTFTNCVAGLESFGAYGTASGTFILCTGGPSSFGAYGTASGAFTNCKGDYESFGTFTAATKLYDCLLETGSATGIYAYLPENVKRLNGSDSDSDTGADMTSTYSIAWTNASGYDLQVSSTLALSNLNTDAETFSVEITSASGANTFTSTKPSGDATWTINIPQYLGSVADTADYEIDIITDNASNTSVNWTLDVVEQAVL